MYVNCAWKIKKQPKIEDGFFISLHFFLCNCYITSAENLPRFALVLRRLLTC